MKAPNKLLGEQEEARLEKIRASSRLPTKFLRIQIIGPEGPVGKTMIQMAIKEFLESKGVKVNITDSKPEFGMLGHKGHLKMKEVARIYKGSSKIPEVRNLNVSIDVIAT